MYIGNQKILIFIQILFIGFDLFVNVCIDQIAKDFTIQLGMFYARIRGHIYSSELLRKVSKMGSPGTAELNRLKSNGKTQIIGFISPCQDSSLF